MILLGRRNSGLKIAVPVDGSHRRSRARRRSVIVNRQQTDVVYLLKITRQKVDRGRALGSDRPAEEKRKGADLCSSYYWCTVKKLRVVLAARSVE